jgi:hypothetical protein
MGNQQLRNILKNINFGTLTASQLSQVGGGVFADINAKVDMTNLTEITNAWRAVTNPSYGQFIPQSGEFFRVTVADSANSIISPTGNEVYRLIGISISNQTLGSLNATVTLKTSDAGGDNEVVIGEVAVGAGGTSMLEATNLGTNIFLDSNATLDVVSSGASLQFDVYACKVAI